VRGIRERPKERGHAEAWDELEQTLGLPDPHRNDRGPARLERHVVRDTARVQRVVQAVRHDVVTAQAGDPERLAPTALFRW
jgi:hypothetical protein